MHDVAERGRKRERRWREATCHMRPAHAREPARAATRDQHQAAPRTNSLPVTYLQSRDRYCFAAPSSSITKSNRPPTSPYSTASACVCFCNTTIVFLSRGISHSGLSCTPFPLPPASPPCLRPPRRPKPYRSALFGEAHRNKCEARSSRNNHRSRLRRRQPARPPQTKGQTHSQSWLRSAKISSEW